MKQVWIPRIGPPSVLEVREAADPSPAPGEVRVRAAFCGINFADIMARMGLYPDAPKLPAVVGYEIAGTIDALGEGVTDLSVGDRVLALTRFGGYSDTVCAATTLVTKLPDNVTLEVAAAIPVQWLTAWLMLVHLGNVRAGDRVLVHAAAGGVGQAAVQICTWKGATVFGTASPGKHERLRALGVAHPIDYRSQDFEAEVMRLTHGEGVDIALDAVGGESLKKSYRCLRHLGRVYAFGAASATKGEKRKLIHALRTLMAFPKLKPTDMMGENRGVHGINLGHLWHRAELLSGMLDEIVGLVGDGTFAPHVDKTFPMEQAADAHAYIQARKNYGKVLLSC